MGVLTVEHWRRTTTRSFRLAAEATQRLYFLDHRRILIGRIFSGRLARRERTPWDAGGHRDERTHHARPQEHRCGGTALRPDAAGFRSEPLSEAIDLVASDGEGNECVARVVGLRITISGMPLGGFQGPEANVVDGYAPRAGVGGYDEPRPWPERQSAHQYDLSPHGRAPLRQEAT